MGLRRAEQLPPAEYSDLPESPYSHDWERAFEPEWRSADYEDRREPHRHIAYINSSLAIPDTDAQALMEARPFREPATSKESSAHLRDRIADAIDGLEPRLRWIFEARYYRGLSVRDVGRELNLAKSHVDRLYQRALGELREQLGDLLGQQ